MAHNNDYTQIWAQANDGLNVWEVAAALGRSTQDLGQLCGDVNASGTRQNATNKWAKYKPIKYNTLGELTLAQRRERNCGLAMRQFGNTDTLWNACITGVPEGMWIYQPPTGIANNEYYRLLDFDAYRKDSRQGQLYFGLYPNPTYKGDEIGTTPPDAGSLGDIGFEDLCGTAQTQETIGGVIYNSFDISGYYKYVLLGPVGTLNDNPMPPSYIFPVDSSHVAGMRAALSNMYGEYRVLSFFSSTALTVPTGYGYTPYNGTFVPAPHEVEIWDKKDNLGIMTNGSFETRSGVLTLVLSTLYTVRQNTISVSSISVQYRYYNGGPTSSWLSISTNPAIGGINSIPKYSDGPLTERLLPTDSNFTGDSVQFRFNVNNSPDNRWFTLQGTIVEE